MMAFAIIQVVVRRAGDRAGHSLDGLMHTAMKLIQMSPWPSLDVRELREQERPPMLSVPAYRGRLASVPAADAAVID
jgi:hypothetical protein